MKFDSVRFVATGREIFEVFKSRRLAWMSNPQRRIQRTRKQPGYRYRMQLKRMDKAWRWAKMQNDEAVLDVYLYSHENVQVKLDTKKRNKANKYSRRRIYLHGLERNDRQSKGCRSKDAEILEIEIRIRLGVHTHYNSSLIGWGRWKRIFSITRYT